MKVIVGRTSTAIIIHLDVDISGAHFFAPLNEEPFAGIVAGDQAGEFGFYPHHRAEMDREEFFRRSQAELEGALRRCSQAGRGEREKVGMVETLAEMD